MRIATPMRLAAILLAGALAACGGHGSGAQSARGASGGSAAAPVQGAQAVAPSDPQNLLVGVWRLSAETDDPAMPTVTCQTTAMTFTPTQLTQVSAAGSETISVRYVASASEVFVITDAGVTNATKYIVLDADDVKQDALLGCTYRRVG